MHHQLRNFVHMEQAVICLEVGDVFSRQDLQVVVPCMLQRFEELQIYRVTDVLADSSAENPHPIPVSLLEVVFVCECAYLRYYWVGW